MNVTILGGTGLLGRHLAPLLVANGHAVTITGRSVAPEPSEGVIGKRVDLTTGEGLTNALGDAEAIVFLASNALKAKQVDIAGTDRILNAIGDRLLMYMSIVGVDRHPLPYYHAKLAVEQMIASSGTGHTILRATQFHDFIAYLLELSTRLPIGFIPLGFVVQPIDTGEVAAELATLVDAGPMGLVPDMCGPEILGIEHLARSYMTARGSERPLIKYPVPGAAGRAFRHGLHTNPERAVGKIRWATYLEGRFGTRISG